MNGKLSAVVHARWFETTILLVILLAGVLAGLETSPVLVARYATLLEALDFAVLAIFIVEIALKLAVHGRQPWHYSFRLFARRAALPVPGDHARQLE